MLISSKTAIDALPIAIGPNVNGFHFAALNMFGIALVPDFARCERARKKKKTIF